MKNETTPATGFLAGGITQEQVDVWKKQYGGAHIITVNTKSGRRLTAYVKPPQTRNTIAVIMMRLQNKQVVEAGEFALRECWLGGDEVLRSPGKDAEEQMASVKAATLALNLFDLPDGDFLKND